MQTDFAKSKGKNQSGKVEDEVFEAFGLFLDFNVVKGRKVRSRIVLAELWFQVSQLLGVDQLMVLSPNVVKCSILCFVLFIIIIDTKDPHLSEVNEVNQSVRILLLHFHIFRVVIEGKADLANGGRLLVFGCIDNEVFEKWVLIDLLLIIIFLICDEVDVWLHFTDSIHLIVYCVYTFVGPHFSDLSFGVTPEIEV